MKLPETCSPNLPALAKYTAVSYKQHMTGKPSFCSFCRLAIISGLISGFFLCLFTGGAVLAAQGTQGDALAAGDPAAGKSRGTDQSGQALWTPIEPGLDYGEFGSGGADAQITVLRIDPAYFEFVLGTSSGDGGGARPLGSWARDKNLVAAINASMYLPDGKTSTGYLRMDNHVNNARVVKRFGAFFAAGPRRKGLPEAAIFDGETQGLRDMLQEYRLVVQNYRLIDSRRRILWAAGGPLYAISAVGQDGAGRILFLHSRRPVEAYSFARQLLELPIDARAVMYVEGGDHAGLHVRTDSFACAYAAMRLPFPFGSGSLQAPLPNILGARRKEAPKTPLQN